MSAAKVPEKVGGFQGLEGSFSKGEDPEGQYVINYNMQHTHNALCIPYDTIL